MDHKNLSADFTLKDCLFETAKLTKNADSNQYSYSGNCTWFDSCSHLLVSNFDFGENF